MVSAYDAWVTREPSWRTEVKCHYCLMTQEDEESWEYVTLHGNHRDDPPDEVVCCRDCLVG